MPGTERREADQHETQVGRDVQRVPHTEQGALVGKQPYAVSAERKGAHGRHF